MKTTTRKGLILVFYAAVVSGFSIFVNSFGVKGFDPSVFTFYKNTVVAVLLFGIMIGLGNIAEIKRLKTRHWIQLVTIGLVGGSIPFVLFFKGLQMTTGTTSAFIHKTLFIYITIFALIFLKEKLTKGLLVGAILLLVGNYVMLRPELALTKGHILIFIATIFWAAENTIAKKTLREVSGTTVAFGRMFFGSMFIMIFLTATGKLPQLVGMSVPQYLWILITAGLLMLYVYSYYNGLKHIKVTTAACILSLGAPLTTALAWLFSGKALTLHSSAGILLILLGVVSVVAFSHNVTNVPAGITHEGN